VMRVSKLGDCNSCFISIKPTIKYESNSSSLHWMRPVCQTCEESLAPFHSRCLFLTGTTFLKSLPPVGGLLHQSTHLSSCVQGDDWPENVLYHDSSYDTCLAVLRQESLASVQETSIAPPLLGQETVDLIQPILVPCRFCLYGCILHHRVSFSIAKLHTAMSCSFGITIASFQRVGDMKIIFVCPLKSFCTKAKVVTDRLYRSSASFHVLSINQPASSKLIAWSLRKRLLLSWLQFQLLYPQVLWDAATQAAWFRFAFTQGECV